MHSPRSASGIASCPRIASGTRVVVRSPHLGMMIIMIIMLIMLLLLVLYIGSGLEEGGVMSSLVRSTKHGVRRGAHLSGALARARPSSVHVLF